MTPVFEPFKKFPIVRRRPEDRHAEGRYYWAVRDGKIVEVAGPKPSRGGMWRHEVGGWVIETGPMLLTGFPNPCYVTDWHPPVSHNGIIGSGKGHRTQAEAYAYHVDMVTEMARQHARLEFDTTRGTLFELNYPFDVDMVTEMARQHARLEFDATRGTLFELNYPFDAEMDEWMAEHAPSGSIEDYTVFGLRMLIPDPNEAFAYKMRWFSGQRAA